MKFVLFGLLHEFLPAAKEIDEVVDAQLDKIYDLILNLNQELEIINFIKS